MLSKRKMPKGKYRVTFTMPPLEGVTQLSLVGDFNNWSISENPLKQAADGSWSVALTFEGEQKYEYRYFADGKVWHNDWQADAYVRNRYGSDNSVLSLVLAEQPAKEAKPAPKKKAAPKKTK